MAAVVYRPRRARIVCWVLAVAVVAVCTVVATGLRGSFGGDSQGYFQRSDQIAMIGLGLFGAVGILMFTRPRVSADAAGVRIRNIVGSYDLPWQVVRAVTFGRGASWLTLELHDDDVVPVLAVQMVDKEYAVEAARTLRALHTAAQQSPAAPTS